MTTPAPLPEFQPAVVNPADVLALAPNDETPDEPTAELVCAITQDNVLPPEAEASADCALLETEAGAIGQAPLESFRETLSASINVELGPDPTQPLTPHEPVTLSVEAGFVESFTFLRMALAQGVSDIHLRVGTPPMLRKDGDILFTKLAPLSEAGMQAFLKDILPEALQERAQQQTDLDFGVEMDRGARFRVNLFYEMGRMGLVLRVIPAHIPTIEQLGIPAVIKKFAELPKGIVLVTGPTGSGKSTTLAGLLNLINHTQSRHIVTLEDPIEFVYKNAKSVISQRQLGTDTDSFPHGLKYALRQDPDVILLGELRDRETINSALHASETGHLVFSTLHTTDAVQTINRIINVFEPHEREPVRQQLGAVLMGTVSQRLAKRADGQGRLAVAEIMMVTPAVRDYILKGQMDEIYQLLREGEYDGMCSLNQALFRAYRNGLITGDEALRVSQEPLELQQMLRGFYHGTQ
ncbi:MAG: type IV pilus twitching motility protein PilT [Candidatus Melainabacteria bacterium]|nr:type IV pilus twitching motility protein PilT [Candidatus Melainabacteria bacterium]